MRMFHINSVFSCCWKHVWAQGSRANKLGWKLWRCTGTGRGPPGNKHLIVHVNFNFKKKEQNKQCIKPILLFFAFVYDGTEMKGPIANAYDFFRNINISISIRGREVSEYFWIIEFFQYYKTSLKNLNYDFLQWNTAWSVCGWC